MGEDAPPLHWVEVVARVLVEGVHEVVGLHPRRGDGVADAVIHQGRGENHRVVLVAEDAAQRDEEENEGLEPRGVVLEGSRAAGGVVVVVRGAGEVAAHTRSTVVRVLEEFVPIHQIDGEGSTRVATTSLAAAGWPAG